ncbi:MAG: GNAT family N-acetyltransferase [Anaerolineae bacterium]|nr:GNAT family N-acetyltransferase [Anaerolineae bacterium]
MIIDDDSFLDAVRARYRVDPCRVSCIALWKVEQLCRASETHIVRAGAHTALYAVRDGRLEFYWSDDREHFALSHVGVAALDFLVLHEDDYLLVSSCLKDYEVSESYPLIYEGPDCASVPVHDDVYVADFDFGRGESFVDAAELLNGCYPGHRHTAEEVATWCDLAVFDPSLWFWVRRSADDEALALAISTYQVSIRETYLDWIQVLPPARGRGLGHLLVAETLCRALPKSDVVRVTGMADDFYRKCGFVGRERWRIASRRWQ